MQCVFALAAEAQNQPPAAAVPLPTVAGLKILVLEGQGATNNTTAHVAIQPVVEVRDQDDRPVEGATVVFRLPPSGPGGTFPNNSASQTVHSDARGQAGATGMVPNAELGRFDIHVTASLQNLTGQATISQTNSQSTLAMRQTTVHKPFWKKKYVLIAAGAAVGAGIAVAVILSHSSNTKTVTISPGTVTIGQ